VAAQLVDHRLPVNFFPHGVIEDVQWHQSGTQGILGHGVYSARTMERGFYPIWPFRPLRAAAVAAGSA
jgi:hypothetical protein